jgi:cation diffusion facilitator family transporter
LKSSTADIRKKAMAASLGIAVVMLGGKLTAYVLTGSDAIFSDAAESVIHIFATLTAAASLWYASRPADVEHLYGHGKIAYFSAGFEGALILLASGAILFSAVRSLLLGPELQNLGIGILITAALGLVNLVLGLFLVRVGRKHDAVILVANGQHVLTDMWTSVGVVGGVAIVWATGIRWLDPVVAIAVALQILANAVSLIRRSIGGLLDAADSGRSRAICGVLDEEVRAGSIDSYHHLRHRKVNDELWIEFHLLIPGSLDLTEAHHRATRIEERLRGLLPDRRVHVLTHVEPSEHDIAHPHGHREVEDPLQG